MSDLKIHKCEACGRLEPPVNIHGGICCHCRADNTKKVCDRLFKGTLVVLWMAVVILGVGLAVCLAGEVM